jgi:hypothetical protein
VREREEKMYQDEDQRRSRERKWKSFSQIFLKALKI